MAGRLLLDCYEGEAIVANILEGLFRRKASSTLRLRVGSLGLYFAWMCAVHPGLCPFPILEQRVYEYARVRRDCSVSPSRVDARVGSLRFAGGLLKFPGTNEAVD